MVGATLQPRLAQLVELLTVVGKTHVSSRHQEVPSSSLGAGIFIAKWCSPPPLSSRAFLRFAQSLLSSGSGDHLDSIRLHRAPRTIERLSDSCRILSHGSGDFYC